jgi:hypothetical protein
VADTLYKQITVLPNPTLNISVSPLTQTVCPGQSTTLTASGASGYTWAPGNLTGSQVAVLPQSSTTYTVKGEDNIGCANSNTVSVTVYPVAAVTVVAEPEVVCQGQPVTLTASGALSYTWSTGAQSQSVTVTQASPAIYTITSIGAYSCSTVSNYTLNVIDCTGLEDWRENKNLFDVYPNPATEFLNVVWMSEGMVRIEIYNTLGQIVYSKQNISSQTGAVDVRYWPRGIYFIKIETDGRYAVRKVLLEQKN